MRRRLILIVLLIQMMLVSVAFAQSSPIASGISRVYTYDRLYRLTTEQVTDPNNTQTYTNDYAYDTVGNRQSKSETNADNPSGIRRTYAYSKADQLITENGIAYTYDLNGNLKTKTDAIGTTTYSYNYDQKLIKVEASTGIAIYKYDADGNRVEAATANSSTKYLVDTNRSLAQVIMEYSIGGSITTSYVYADDLISMTRNNQTSYYHFDGLGSTRLLTNSSGTITDKYDYDAFGNIIARTGTTENTFLFTGQQYDANIGFYYQRARYYQPTTGRFTAYDPIEGDPYTPISLHKYLYSADDPVNKVDPSGEQFSIAEEVATVGLSDVLSNISISTFPRSLRFIYQLRVSSDRIMPGWNDFRMKVTRNNQEMYSFIVGRDTAGGHMPYVGMSYISKPYPSSLPQIQTGGYFSSIANAGKYGIHGGRGTHRWVTHGCIRMEQGDFDKLYGFLAEEATKKNVNEIQGWYKNAYLVADVIATDPEPKFRVGGNHQ